MKLVRQGCSMRAVGRHLGYEPSIEERVTQTVIDQDLNTLLPAEQFRRIRRILKGEILQMLRQV